jgi:hypothetical protein
MLHIDFEDHEVEDFQKLLNRALNTLEPEKWPSFALALVNAVEQKVAEIKGKVVP